MSLSHEAKLAFVHKQTKLALDHVKEEDPVKLAAGGLLGNITNPLGLSDNYQANGANIQSGTNQNQIGTAYNQAQTGINQTQDLAKTTAPGVAQGTGAQANLSNQLTARAAGQGPSPAQAALNQQTGNNVATTAALIAGGRGVSANPGAAAEAAARTGAGVQQQAVGQGATLQAQEQIAAQNNLANLSATQVNQGLQGTQLNNSVAQNEQGIIQNANSSFNNAEVSNIASANAANAAVAANNQNANANLFGGITSGLSALFAKGGMVRMSKGGHVLDAEHRAAIPKEDFALPGKRYPIHDEAHARNALARVSQYGTPAEKAKVRAAVSKKHPNIGVKKMANGGMATPDPSSSPSPIPSSHPTREPDPEKAAAATRGVNLPGWPGLDKVISNVKDGINHYAGGTVQGYADGGAVLNTGQVNGPQSFVGQFLNTSQQSSSAPAPLTAPVSTAPAPDLSKSVQTTIKGVQDKHTKQNQQTMAEGTNQVNADPTRPGVELDATNENPDMLLSAKGGAINAKDGKEQAEVKGDSLKNDKIPAMLSEGEGVIDRETMEAEGPLGDMARTLMKHVEANKKKGKK